MNYERQVSTRMEPKELVIASELLPVVEIAAIESSKLMGSGDRNAADHAAVSAMRTALDKCDIDGRIVIGEGERDEAPMLYIGEEVGRRDSENKVDIAVDPLEGTNLVAFGKENATAVMAISERGGLLHAPDIYMMKLVVPARAAGKCDLENSVEDNARIIADSLERDLNELVAVVLERPRHEDIIAELRRIGVRIKLIGDGDLSAGIAAAVEGTGVHFVIGIGGAPEGVLTAAALQCLGGEILAKLHPKNDEQRARCETMGADWNRVLRTDDMAPGEDTVFIASGVTKGDLLDGVRFFGTGVRVNSVVMSRRSQSIRFTDSIYLESRGNVPVSRL